MKIIAIILVFGIIVFVHELGHFLFAKLNKIKVLEFAIGMGPAIVKWGKHETKYALRVLPIGGYCMMEGEDEESDDPRSFSNKSCLARLSVLFAGPFFNFVLAFILDFPKYKGTNLPAAAYGLIGFPPPRGFPAAAIQCCDGC